jgi:ATP-dependent DNA helicase RecQ
MSVAQDTLPALLKRHFGYDSFRPLQEEIINDIVAGRDVFALLPTGGGKSLCFQLPALIKAGLTVVISPLIALMKDQVDALTVNGIPATFLNSSLDADEARARWRGLHEGKYRLLYVAPERLMLGDFIEQLGKWNVNLIAVDEAHCISEWGHDFRPEYRKLAGLRDAFPTTPILALTATATEHVREDIVRLLRLKDARRYVASFNRPNLFYRVWPKQNAYQQILNFVRARPNESGIVYCFSRQSAEDLAEHLKKDGVAAKPYHAGLANTTRAKNQDHFLRDSAQVICATIAFGMGINKSNVRFVIHHDMPKNVEGYYQETGRAGRDGLPSECVLLFNPGDAQKQSRFIEMKSDPNEQAIARRQLKEIVSFCETIDCRRAFLLNYFGEAHPGACGSCDNCLTPRATFDGTVAAQKFLSCVYRIRMKSGFSVGMGHVVDVLRGAKTEKMERWGHTELSTYGIGKEFRKGEWQALGRELTRLGFVAQTDGALSTLRLTEAGLAILKERRTVALTQPMVPTVTEKSASATSGLSSDEQTLFDRLRQLRRQLADDQNVPAYIVFSDATLRQMAQRRPTTLAQFATISGVGEKKQKAYGEAFLEEIGRS